jgi:hypothetical protein
MDKGSLWLGGPNKIYLQTSLVILISFSRWQIRRTVQLKGVNEDMFPFADIILFWVKSQSIGLNCWVNNISPFVSQKFACNRKIQSR